MLGNVNVLPQYNKNILLLLSAVYYRNYALLWSCVVVAGEVSWSNVWTSAVADRNRTFGTLFNQELWISVKVGIRNNSGYTCMDIISIQYIRQRPLTKYLRCPLFIPTISSMSIVHINHCWYQPFPIPKVVNIKVDHPMLSNKYNSAATNVWDVEQEEYWNKAPYVLFFLPNQEEFIYYYFLSPNFIGNSPQFG